MADYPTRAEALELMHEYTESTSLRKHMYAVEAAMRAYAEKYGEDVELWGLTGLIHDFDYERWPNDEHSPTAEHPSAGVAILRERGWPEEALDAVMAHADYTGVPAESLMAKTLRAVDELAGFITACALVRPTRISDLGARSVKKKLKDKAFAAAVSRDDIREGQEALGEDLTEHIEFVVAAMRGIADELGLQGDA
ncbi:MAG: HDIG domain-containing metalloprotein [Gemmatimonadota bacterium]